MAIYKFRIIIIIIVITSLPWPIFAASPDSVLDAVAVFLDAICDCV